MTSSMTAVTSGVPDFEVPEHYFGGSWAPKFRKGSFGRLSRVGHRSDLSNLCCTVLGRDGHRVLVRTSLGDCLSVGENWLEEMANQEIKQGIVLCPSREISRVDENSALASSPRQSLSNGSPRSKTLGVSLSPRRVKPEGMASVGMSLGGNSPLSSRDGSGGADPSSPRESGFPRNFFGRPVDVVSFVGDSKVLVSLSLQGPSIDSGPSGQSESMTGISSQSRFTVAREDFVPLPPGGHGGMNGANSGLGHANRALGVIALRAAKRAAVAAADGRVRDRMMSGERGGVGSERDIAASHLPGMVSGHAMRPRKSSMNLSAGSMFSGSCARLVAADVSSLVNASLNPMRRCGMARKLVYSLPGFAELVIRTLFTLHEDSRFQGKGFEVDPERCVEVAKRLKQSDHAGAPSSGAGALQVDATLIANLADSNTTVSSLLFAVDVDYQGFRGEIVKLANKMTIGEANKGSEGAGAAESHAPTSHGSSSPLVGPGSSSYSATGSYAAPTGLSLGDSVSQLLSAASSLTAPIHDTQGVPHWSHGSSSSDAPTGSASPIGGQKTETLQKAVSQLMAHRKRLLNK